jgi:hypothetical protein
MNDNVLSMPMTHDIRVIDKVCKNRKTGKAQDIMSISYEHIKHSGANVFMVFVLMFPQLRYIAKDILKECDKFLYLKVATTFLWIHINRGIYISHSVTNPSARTILALTLWQS